MDIVVYRYFHSYVHLRFKHAVLGTLGYLGCTCKSEVVVFVNKREEDVATEPAIKN